MKRRILASVVIAVGIVLIAVTAARNLFAVGPAFEEMIDDFRPWITDESIATLRSDLGGLGSAIESFETEMVPALADRLKMTPQEFAITLGAQYPAVQTGLEVVPAAAASFSGIIDLLDEQQANFMSADEIPTAQLPATTVPWGIALAGVLAVAVGLAMLVAGRIGDLFAVVLGVLLVLASVVLSLPAKATDADALNGALEPVYTAEMVAGAAGAVEALGAMGTEMTESMVPGLGQMLGMAPDQVMVFVATEFPAVAGALETMPDAVGRFQGMVGAFEANLGNYDTLRPVAFAPIVWTMVIGGLVMALAAGAALLPSKTARETSPVVEEPRVPVGV